MAKKKTLSNISLKRFVGQSYLHAYHFGE